MGSSINELMYLINEYIINEFVLSSLKKQTKQKRPPMSQILGVT